MSESSDLNVRLSRLEAQCRWQRRGLTLALLAGLSLVLMAPAPAVRPVTASAFVLVDDAGQSRAQLAVDSEGAVSLLLRTASGSGDAGFIVSPSGASAFRLRSPKRTATIEVADDGRAELRFNQSHAKTAVAVGIDAAGMPRASLNDKTGKVVFQAP